MISKQLAAIHKCDVQGGQIYYIVMNQTAEGLPILVVNGGPGGSHDYLKPLADLLPNHPIIFYDQLDCGLADKVNDPSLWVLERFVDEIECLRVHLKLSEFILYGHSAGTMIALDYALDKPQYLTRLILSSPVASVRLFSQHMLQILDSFPESIKAILIKQHQTPELSCKYEIMEANTHHAMLYFCRMPIWPDLLFESALKLNNCLHDYLWGPSDFFLTGSLRHYERMAQLPALKVKTLLCCGEYDFTDGNSCYTYAAAIPNAHVRIIANASHNPHMEEPAQYALVLNQFIGTSS